MRVIKMSELGYSEAITGISLSYGTSYDRAREASNRLAIQDGGHNKFLESICVWIDITAPRYWWQQFDTYRVGVTKQSESTMHTIMRRPLSSLDFEGDISRPHLEDLNAAINSRDFDYVKENLPEGYLQRRIVCTNYKALRNIFRQRLNHRLRLWQTFIYSLYSQLSQPSFFRDIINSETIFNQTEE